MGVAYILDAVRPPRGKGQAPGALARQPPHELLALILNGAPH